MKNQIQTQNIRRLNAISKIFDINDFYSITIGNSCINLQGYFNPEIIKKAIKIKFKNSIDQNGYLEFKRNNYCITLT